MRMWSNGWVLFPAERPYQTETTSPLSNMQQTVKANRLRGMHAAPELEQALRTGLIPIVRPLATRRKSSAVPSLDVLLVTPARPATRESEPEDRAANHYFNRASRFVLGGGSTVDRVWEDPLDAKDDPSDDQLDQFSVWSPITESSCEGYFSDRFAMSDNESADEPGMSCCLNIPVRIITEIDMLLRQNCLTSGGS